MYSRQPTSNHGQRIYDHHNHERLAPNRTYTMQTSSTDPPKREAPVSSTSMPRPDENADRRPPSSQLPNDTKYLTNAMERCSISRARSNDHLLETTNGKSPYARKDLPLKQKSKSFENLGNDEDEVSCVYYGC